MAEVVDNIATEAVGDVVAAGQTDGGGVAIGGGRQRCGSEGCWAENSNNFGSRGGNRAAFVRPGPSLLCNFKS